MKTLFLLCFVSLLFLLGGRAIRAQLYDPFMGQEASRYSSERGTDLDLCPDFEPTPHPAPPPPPD